MNRRNLALVSLFSISVSTTFAGRIVAGQDVNTFSSSVAGPNEDRFAVNIAQWLIGSSSGTILAVESAPNDGSRDYAANVKTALANAGFRVTYISSASIVAGETLEDLRPYDAVFVGVTWPTEAAIGSSALHLSGQV